MRNPQNPNEERVRINFDKTMLNEASKYAARCGMTLSQYITGLVERDMGREIRHRTNG